MVGNNMEDNCYYILNDDQLLELRRLFLKKITGTNPWTLETISNHFNNPVKTPRQKYILRRQIKQLKNCFIDLKLLSNIGKGYFIPKTVEDFSNIKTFYFTRYTAFFKQYELFNEEGKKAVPTTIRDGDMQITIENA